MLENGLTEEEIAAKYAAPVPAVFHQVENQLAA
jgi:hypothetical protein